MIDPKYEADDAILTYELRQCESEELDQWREEFEVAWQLPTVERTSDMTSLHMLDALEKSLEAPQPPICDPAISMYLRTRNLQSYLLLSYLGLLGVEHDEISEARAERIERYLDTVNAIVITAELGLGAEWLPAFKDK